MSSNFLHTKKLNFCDESILERIELQKYLSKELTIFPKLNFEISSNSVVQYSTKIPKKTLPINTNKISKLWFEFLAEIEYMHSCNYVHGDILMKNIIFDGNNFRLIDHEMILNYKGHLRVTYPWIDAKDLRTGKITTATDKICIEATELRLFDKIGYDNFRTIHTNKLKLKL